MIAEERESKLRLNPRVYVWVWVALILLTTVTVSVAGMNLGRVGIFVALAIAGVKSGLVLAYFMHLKYERALVLKVMIPGTLAIFILFMGIVFLDVVFR